MEKDIAQYIRKHTLFVATLIVGGFLLLAFGEYYLYRKTKELNKMVSEGMMQIKEEIKYYPDMPDYEMMEEDLIKEP